MNEMSLTDELNIMNELIGKRVIGFEKIREVGNKMIRFEGENSPYRNNGLYADIMILEDGTRYYVEMTDYDCCANAYGTFYLPDGEFEGVITDVDSSEKTVEHDSEHTTRYATIKLLFENTKMAEIRMSANNGNADYYMSVATLIARPIVDYPNSTSYIEDMKTFNDSERYVYNLQSR